MSKEIKCPKYEFCLFTSFDENIIEHHIKNYHDPNKFKYCFFCGFCSKKDALILQHNCSYARLREIEAERIFQFDKTIKVSSFNTPGPSGINSNFTPNRKINKQVFKYRSVYSSDSEPELDNLDDKNDKDFRMSSDEEPRRKFQSSKKRKRSVTTRSKRKQFKEDDFDKKALEDDYVEGEFVEDDQSDKKFVKKKNKGTGLVKDKKIKKKVKAGKSNKLGAESLSNKDNGDTLVTKIISRDDNNNLVDSNNKYKKPPKEQFKKLRKEELNKLPEVEPEKSAFENSEKLIEEHLEIDEAIYNMIEKELSKAHGKSPSFST